MGDMASYYDERDVDEYAAYDPWGTASTSRRTPIATRRGGIKYPARKDTSVGRTPQQKLEQAQELLESIQEEIRSLQRQAARYPAEPSRTTISVMVRHTPRGKEYQYLMLRCGNRWYTTAAGDKNKQFEDWTGVADWLTGPNVRQFTITELEPVVEF